MIWLILAIGVGALLLVVLLVLERRFEYRSTKHAEKELDRVKHRLDTMTVELEPPRETRDADDYLKGEINTGPPQSEARRGDASD